MIAKGELVEEPHQLTNLNHIWQRKFPFNVFKALIAMFWNLQSLWPFSLTKPDLPRFRCSSRHVLSVNLIFVHFSMTSLIHHLSLVAFSKKNNFRKFSQRHPQATSNIRQLVIKVVKYVFHDQYRCWWRHQATPMVMWLILRRCKGPQANYFVGSFPNDLIFMFLNIIFIIWLAPRSASGQDDPNRALWLATRAGKMEPSRPLGTTRRNPQEKFPGKPYNKSFIGRVFFGQDGWILASFFSCEFMDSTSSRFINKQKKSLANIQPSLPHNCSITHIYYAMHRFCFIFNRSDFDRILKYWFYKRNA